MGGLGGDTKTGEMTHLGTVREPSREEARRAPWATDAFVSNLPDKPRLVINYRYINSPLPKGPFRYESLAALAMELVLGEHFVSWDIKSAYHHMPLHKEVRPYLVFHVGPKLYEPQCLAFGLFLAP